MSLQISKEERENRELVLTIGVDQARVDQELRKAARKIASDYRIPGFRKGKAPYHIIVQQVGLPALYNEFIEPLGQTVYQEALTQEGLEPYARASLEDVKLEPSLTYTLAMPLDPEIDLGDYKALRVEEDPITIDEADVEKQLDEYRDKQASWVDVDRPSQYGDMLNINVYSVLINDDGTPNLDETGAETVVLQETDWDVTPDQENPMEPPGFDEALLGLTPGDEKEFVLSWPAEGQSIHAGKQARFQVKLNGIQAYEKAELTDEFAQTIGPDINTLDDLKENVRATLRERAKGQAENAFLEKVLDALLAQAKLNYPPVVIEDQIDSMINEMEMQLRRFGIQDIESFYRQTGQDRDQTRTNLRPEATRQAERNLLLSELLRIENLTISDEEVEARINVLLANNDPETSQQLAAMFRHESGRAILESQLLREKSIDRLLAIARGKGDEEPAPATAATPTEASTEGPAGETPAAEADAPQA
ncbi:MAG: trigger factor [Caldilineaceae bacterium]|nr:trigger factor [Caldilineaceae bacterium]